MKILIQDRAAIPVPSQREYTENGYLKVPGRVALAGNVQQYLAEELGLADRPGNTVVNVYRPPESVFDPASLATYQGVDITVEHPTAMVDATTYKRVSVGHAVSVGRQEGNGVVVDLLIKDADAIKAIEAGKCELSAGYLAEYIRRPGTAPDGTPYEFVQDGIAVNHIAICDKARAGHLARLFDHKTADKEPVMTYKVTLDSGQKVEVADESTSMLIQSTIDGLRKRVADAEEEKTKAELTKDEAEAKADALDEENEELKKQASEDSISKRLADVLAVTDAARKLAGAEFTCDSVNPLEIKRAALAVRLPKRSWADKSEAYVSAAWDSEMEKKEAEDEDEEDEKAKTTDSHRQLGADLSKVKVADAQTTLDAAYKARMDRTANAWKGN
ncbi:MAG: DUF2213 domain-containing protein [Pigmentiphaga sp.]